MPGVNPAYVIGRTQVALGSASINLASATTQTIATLGSSGIPWAVAVPNGVVTVTSVVFDAPVGVTGTATYTLGSSTGLTDFSGSTTVSQFPQINTGGPANYPNGTIFRINVTGAAAAGTCTVTVYGWVN